MKSALALSPIPESRWVIVKGPLSGAVRGMSLPNFTIGRSPDCEFTLAEDPKCSRRHADVRWTTGGYEIKNLSDSNPVYVNGREVETAQLKSGDVIKLGETEMQFHLVSAPQLVTQPVSPPVAGFPGYFPSGAPPAMGDMTRPRGRARAPTKKPVRAGGIKIVAVVLGLLILWLVIPEDKATKKAMQLRTEQQIQSDIEAANKLREAEEQRLAMAGQIASRQAQENYVRGFRDFREGQFERALESFQACLALQPEHQLCTRYYRLADRKFRELIQYHMILGKKYRDQNQFKPCRATFRTVMFMVKNAESPEFKEAKANYEACHVRAEGRF